MNLYEWEGKELFRTCGITTPRGVVVRRGEHIPDVFHLFEVQEVVLKAQVLSGKRGKHGGIHFCTDYTDVCRVVGELFHQNICGQYVASVLIEEKLDIIAEHYLSITIDTHACQPMMLYTQYGGMDIEDVPEASITKYVLDIRDTLFDFDIPFGREVWNCFVDTDCRQVEINPLAQTRDGRWVAVDAKIALDDDAFFRHESWSVYEPRTMLGRLPTEREQEASRIDEGEAYYRGTAGKYIEMDGDIAILFSGGGASIANMDTLIAVGLNPANYTEYSGNPPREKVRELAKIVLSKPGLRGLWIAGGVANFTNVQETFHGIVDALDSIQPSFPIVVRRAGPFDTEGMELLQACTRRNHLNMRLYGKEVSMSETAHILAEMINHS